MTSVALNHRQRRFVHEYLSTGNGAEAARRAGYSHRSARQIAHCLKTQDQVQRAIDLGQLSTVQESRAVKQRATDMLRESFRQARNAKEMLKATDSLCRLHRLI